jgi:hypothetical protein
MLKAGGQPLHPHQLGTDFSPPLAGQLLGSQTRVTREDVTTADIHSIFPFDFKNHLKITAL